MAAIFGTALIAITGMSVIALLVQYMAFRAFAMNKGEEDYWTLRRRATWKETPKPLL